MNRTLLTSVLCAVALVTGCGHDAAALDRPGAMACQGGFLAGTAQLNGQPDAEALHLIQAYQASATSRTPLVLAWRNDHATLGTAVKKTQPEADEAVRVLLNVCKASGFTVSAPSAPSTSPSGSPAP